MYSSGIKPRPLYCQQLLPELMFFFFFFWAQSICPRCTAAMQAYCATLVLFKCFRRPHFRYQSVLLVHITRETPQQRKVELRGQESWPVILPKCRLPRYIQGSFTCHKSTTWDRRLYFPSEGRRAEDFYLSLKNLTASAGFEPANLRTKGQHATSRPPQPLVTDLHHRLHKPQQGNNGFQKQ